MNASHNDLMGVPGDEDGGGMTAFVVFSSMGFYPVTPGTDQYVFGSPLFNKVKLNFENGKRLVLSAPKNSKENIYIQDIILNGKKIRNNYIRQSDLYKGGTLIYRMGPEPEKKRGTKEESYPYSMSLFQK